MKNISTRNIIIILVLLVITALSFFPISNWALSPDTFKETISVLDEKENTVMELAAASAAMSVAITLLPDDWATPIANKLADLGSYFVIILCAIFLEKYLVSFVAYAAFRYLIPAAAILILINLYWKKESVARLAMKIALFAIAITLVIPTGVKLSCMIEDRYDNSVEAAIASASEITDEVNATSETAVDNTEKKGFWDKASSLADTLVDKVKSGTKDLANKAENVMSDMLNAIAVLIVTSCVIPILVLFFFVWLAKIILDINIDMPNLGWFKKKNLL